MAWRVAIFALLTFFLPVPAQELSRLVADSLEFMNPAKERPEASYLWRMRLSKKELDPLGKVRAENITVSERIIFDGEPVVRHLEVDGRKLTSDELRRQEPELRRAIAESRAQSPAERDRRRRGEAEENAWILEIPQALVFRVAGERVINNRPAYIVSCSPKPGYVPRNMRARVFTKMNGILLIDKADRQLAEAEAETFDAVNVGFGILGKIEKGTKFRLARMRLRDGNWVMREQEIRFSGRFMMVKHVGREIFMQWFDHRPMHPR